VFGTGRLVLSGRKGKWAKKMYRHAAGGVLMVDVWVPEDDGKKEEKRGEGSQKAGETKGRIHAPPNLVFSFDANVLLG
jgi:hypothetical protein